MPKRPSGSGALYNPQIMAATLYLPKASPYIILAIAFYINQKRSRRGGRDLLAKCYVVLSYGNFEDL